MDEKPTQDQQAPVQWVQGITAILRVAARLAAKCGRRDLVQQLSATRKRLEDHAQHMVRIVVVGEFKKGKSSLVNALLNAPVCPVSDTGSTAVPLTVRYAEQPEVSLAYLPSGDGGKNATSASAPLEELAEQVLRAPPDGAGNRLFRVEVGVPNQMLAQGVSFVDTPVGGNTVVDAATLGALPTAHAVIFTTDAAQELSASEIEMLRMVRSLCPTVVCAVTKIDLYPHWRRIVELDREHLRGAGIDVPVFPVSAALQTQAARERDRDLYIESGCAPLLKHLRENVVDDVERLALEAAAKDFGSVLDQVEQVLTVRQAALTDEKRGAELVEQLQAATKRAEAMRGVTSRWQQVLGDGFGNLSSDVDFDQRRRIRETVKAAEESIAQGDPAGNWDVFEAWLRRRLTTDVVANYALLEEGAAELGWAVAEQFAEEEGEIELSVRATAPGELLAEIERAESAKVTGNKLAGKTVKGGMLLFRTVSRLAMTTRLNPLSVAVQVFSGAGSLWSQHKREIQQRRQQAKVAVNQYVEELKFHIGKDSKDTLRRVQREMRSTFSEKATELQNAANQSLAAAKQALQESKAQQQKSLPEIQEARKAAAALRNRAETVFKTVREGARDETATAHPAS
ncbi:dynamin family protein [Saccharopolyspora shandongensis]|uniref:dynamin family protein n=1 Tax=Saccharopolyspora shandongensis TaxID=418495 RepID=UPI0033FC8E89